jgi:hypothetical protein
MAIRQAQGMIIPLVNKQRLAGYGAVAPACSEINQF